MVRLAFRVVQNPQYLKDFSHRFGIGLPSPDSPPDQMRIWIHAVSVGEVNAAVPLVQEILKIFGDAQVIITTMTPTGSERVRNVFGDSVFHCLLPYDYPGAMKRLLDRLNPGIAMVMETEIWPNMITECHRRKIPLIYTNVRMSARSCKGYKRFRALFSRVLSMVDQFAVQSNADAERIIELGAQSERVKVTGNIKFEVVLPPSVKEAAQSVRRDLGWDRPVWVVGSTHEGEEAQIIDALVTIRKDIPDILTVLVPRHPERFLAVSRLCTRHGFKTVQRSQVKSDIPIDTEIYIGDTMGELNLILCSGDLAFIGGSLVPTGGHNLLEACAAGVAVIYGPHMFNFQEISDLVLAKGAGIQVMDTGELAEVVIRLFRDPVLRDQYGTEGETLIEENKGALSHILEMLHSRYPQHLLHK